MRMSGLRAVSLAGILVFCRSTGVLADIPITITGTIIEPACSVTDASGSGQTEVNFGPVSLEDVGTVKAQQSLTMRVTCDDSAPSGKSLKMFITPGSNGTITWSGQPVLGTSLSGLGIDLTDSSQTRIPLSTWVDVPGVDTSVAAPSGEMTLRAMLVSPDTSTLTAGNFSATASVVVSYI
ncbi:fimbrial protein [Salmonella enterica subsp. enterica]|uniref:Fimbrial protein n=1 Tax=Salmonella newport TaxID=108619 RepID=A0A5W5WGX6_SALNE|nr:fimbrial protein [Salmonella enterica subsp. enterica serovar Newport]ECI7967259.1 fimbrial protein [Salmonella enterica subsp. enterica]ECN0284871.1 fimbrial protein [Salmonella enterica subsp. enterica serovar Newport]EEG3121340.1 fimbrial protein [Salmonella enterica subsp. enterica serovar Isangi]MLR41217.1 fimbrial protein [Salmonella enterica subsp. enterica serovar Baildon]